jgi:hypothetical protein
MGEASLSKRERRLAPPPTHSSSSLLSHLRLVAAVAFPAVVTIAAEAGKRARS